MTELAIDTHGFVKRLISSGFTEAQAETLADAQLKFLEARLATKDDLRDLREELKAEIASVHAELKAEIADVRAELKAEIAELRAEIVQIKAELALMKSEFTSLLVRSQIATGAAIITILSFINYLTG